MHDRLRLRRGCLRFNHSPRPPVPGGRGGAPTCVCRPGALLGVIGVTLTGSGTFLLEACLPLASSPDAVMRAEPSAPRVDRAAASMAANHRRSSSVSASLPPPPGKGAIGVAAASGFAQWLAGCRQVRGSCLGGHLALLCAQLARPVCATARGGWLACFQWASVCCVLPGTTSPLPLQSLRGVCWNCGSMAPPPRRFAPELFSNCSVRGTPNSSFPFPNWQSLLCTHKRETAAGRGGPALMANASCKMRRSDFMPSGPASASTNRDRGRGRQQRCRRHVTSSRHQRPAVAGQGTAGQRRAQGPLPHAARSGVSNASAKAPRAAARRLQRQTHTPPTHTHTCASDPPRAIMQPACNNNTGSLCQGLSQAVT